MLGNIDVSKICRIVEWEGEKFGIEDNNWINEMYDEEKKTGWVLRTIFWRNKDHLSMWGNC